MFEKIVVGRCSSGFASCCISAYSIKRKKPGSSDLDQGSPIMFCEGPFQKLAHF